jgi:hypothetical protein
MAFSFFIGTTIDDPLVSTITVAVTNALAMWMFGENSAWVVMISVISVLIGHARFGVRKADISKSEWRINTQLISMALFVFIDMCALRISHKTTIDGYPSGLFETVNMFCLFALLEYGSELLGARRFQMQISATAGSLGILFMGIIFPCILDRRELSNGEIVMHVAICLGTAFLISITIPIISSPKKMGLPIVNLHIQNVIYVKSS